MGAFIKNVDAIRSATGAHVCIVHHTGKDAAKGARGHSSLRAATDTEIELTTKDGISTAQVTKQRDGKIPPPFSYTLREVVLGADSDGDPVTTCIVEPCETPVARVGPSGAHSCAYRKMGFLISPRGASLGTIRKTNARRLGAGYTRFTRRAWSGSMSLTSGASPAGGQRGQKGTNPHLSPRPHQGGIGGTKGTTPFRGCPSVPHPSEGRSKRPRPGGVAVTANLHTGGGFTVKQAAVLM
jgi:hypothetical protein